MMNKKNDCLNNDFLSCPTCNMKLEKKYLGQRCPRCNSIVILKCCKGCTDNNCSKK
ncbi:MAG: hypothetical protein PHC34_06880 [Candidatus Gastranaerophilales bacterium]|nr:hypothetical protein [Candidatus Gastranaerophilales bacterium]